MTGVIHEALTPISWLSGRWITEDGLGYFSNVPEFQYHEELEFTCIGQPMFNYLSTSRRPEKGTPMHQERGFLCIKPGSNDVAFIVSHNFGLTTLEEGQCDAVGKVIRLSTANISRMSFAKPPIVKSLVREIRIIAPDTLQMILHMETEDTPLSEHLKAVYKRA